MTDKEKIRSIVARFFNVTESAVTENFIFPRERLNASVGRATFHAAIKRMAGADLPAAFSAKTFGELFDEAKTPAVADNSKENKSADLQSVENSPASNFGVGIDIERVENLPVAADFWSEPFFTENFTAAEIAYCQRQPDPRESFCGIWSAKEAVKKCGVQFSRLSPAEIEILHDAQGRPVLWLAQNERLAKDCFVSISHSNGVSAAVCVSGISTTRNPFGEQIKPAPSNQRLVWICIALSILSLLLWAIRFF